jgi:signal transduction histidine kinase
MLNTSLFNRLSFFVTRNADYAIALQACLPSLTSAFLEPQVSALVTTIGLAITAAMVSFGKRKKAAYLQIPETSGVWGIAAASYFATSAVLVTIPGSASVGLTATLTSVLCLLLYERHTCRKLAFKRVARRRLQHRRWQAERSKLENQWNERLQWLAGIQHDMRQPLHALGLLIVHPSMQNDARFANLVLQLASCQRWLHELAENAMEATKIQLGGRVVGSSESSCVSQILDDLGPWVRPMAELKGLSLELSDNDGSIQTDIRRLKRVLINLIHNAVRHTEHGKVWLEYRREKGGIHCFQVGDTGPGLPDDVIAQMFETHEALRGRLPKRGLGLYVAKSFCHELGWRLDIDRSDKRGTVFSLRLVDRIAAKRSEKVAVS